MRVDPALGAAPVRHDQPMGTAFLGPDDRAHRPVPGFDEREWLAVKAVLVAAHAGDREAYAEQLLRLDAVARMSGKPGSYLWYCLRYRIVETFDRLPLQSELKVIAAQVAPAFSSLIDLDQSLILELLEVAFDFRQPSSRIEGSYLVVVASGVLAPLLDNVDRELDAMLPDLKAWYLANTEKFRKLEPPLM